MRELTLDKIIEYAEKIELESSNFYSSAIELVNDGEVKNLLIKLSYEEKDHFNYLESLREKVNLDNKYPNEPIAMKVDIFNKIVDTANIEREFTAKNVLEVALQREIDTEQTYKMLLTLTAMTEDVLDLFELLRKQEKAHVNKIQKRLNN